MRGACLAQQGKHAQSTRQERGPAAPSSFAPPLRKPAAPAATGPTATPQGTAKDRGRNARLGSAGMTPFNRIRGRLARHGGPPSSRGAAASRLSAQSRGVLMKRSFRKPLATSRLAPDQAARQGSCPAWPSTSCASLRRSSPFSTRITRRLAAGQSTWPLPVGKACSA